MLRGRSIRIKLSRVMFLTSLAVLLLTCSAFFIYEFVTFRQIHVRELSTLGQIIASNSTAALAFNDTEAAGEILAALKAEPHIVVSCLYDADAKIFTYYPASFSRIQLPNVPLDQGYDFRDGYLDGFQQVTQGNKTLGVLYLRSDMEAMYARFRLYGGITAIVIVLALLLSYFLSRYLQRQISNPILSLAETAKAISDRQNYAVRAIKLDEDEIGSLTDAFNHMLNRIQKQTGDLLESNNRVKSVINSALSAVILMDSGGRITDWNDRAVEIFGWKYDEMIGQDLSTTIIPERYRVAHQNGLAQFLLSGKGPVLNKVIEMSAIRKNGVEFPVELLISTLKTDNVLSFCGFVTDITERKQAEEKIRLFQQKLEQLVEERTQELQSVNNELESFSYSISHDLRAPLRSIHGYMNILSEEYGDKLDDEANRLMNIILMSGQRMGQLIDDLLAFSRLGRKELVKSDVSMNSIASEIIKEHQKLDLERALEVNLLSLPNARADHSTIRQVWVNLISNAIKYSKKKELIHVEIGSVEKEGATVYYVQDNGVGFDMKYYDKLFGVFQRLHSHTEFEGTGVGLAIVQRIIMKHGGKIWAEGKVNNGATFYFSLPQ